MKNKFISALLAGCLVVGCSGGTYAEGNDTTMVTTMTGQKIPLEITVQDPVFSVTVPIKLPAVLSANGRMAKPGEAQIINSSTLPIKVSKCVFDTSTSNGWSSRPHFETEDFDSPNVYCLFINDIDHSSREESLIKSFSTIAADGGTEAFTYEIHAAPRTAGVDTALTGGVTFVFDWAI